MTHETIAGELAGRPTIVSTDGERDVVRACVIIDDHPTLPEILTVELRGRNAVVAAARLADANGHLVTAELWSGPGHDPSKPWPVTGLRPALNIDKAPPERPGPGASDTGRIHHQIVELYARPVAEVLAGTRPPASLERILHPDIADRFRRLAHPLGSGPVTIGRTYVQTGYPRIDVSAAVRIGDTTHPLALGCNVSSGEPLIDAVMTPRLRLSCARRAPLAAAHLAASTAAAHAPSPVQARQR